MGQTKPTIILLPLFVFLCGMMFLIFGLSTINDRASIVVDGTIISSETQCEQSNNSRCVTTYTLQSPNSKSKSYYSAGYTDQSLPRGFPDGTRIWKQKGKLSFEANGYEINDFPLFFYLLCAIIGTTLAIGGFTMFVLIAHTTFKQPVHKKNSGKKFT